MHQRETIHELTGEGLRKARRLASYEADPEPDRETMTGGAALWLALGTVALLLFLAGLVGLALGTHAVLSAFHVGAVAFKVS